MKAIELRRVGELKMGERPVPHPVAGEALLRVTHCALCRTDAKMWSRGHRDLVVPRVLGHEVCGTKEDGTRWAVWPGTACGECRACREGLENLCSSMRILGFHRDGGLAQWVAAPASSLLCLPPALPGPLACMAEPVACALNGLDRLALREGENLLILGGGTLGWMLAVAARARGAFPFVMERSESKLRRASTLRDATGVPAGTHLPEERFHAAVNAAPGVETLRAGVERLWPGGRFCLFSGLTGEEPVEPSFLNEIHYRQLTVTGAYGCTRGQMGRALDLLTSHRAAFEGLLEERISLERVPERMEGVLSGELFKFVVEMESGA